MTSCYHNCSECSQPILNHTLLLTLNVSPPHCILHTNCTVSLMFVYSFSHMNVPIILFTGNDELGLLGILRRPATPDSVHTPLLFCLYFSMNLPLYYCITSRLAGISLLCTNPSILNPFRSVWVSRM